jgi:hypothetical protein
MNRAVLQRQAVDALRHELQPGERIAAGSLVTSNPSRCGMAQIPGHKPILLHVGRAGRKDFADVEIALARSGAFAKLEPPYPSAQNLSTTAYRH